MSEKSKIICTDAISGSISIKADDSIRIRLNVTLTEALNETDVIKLVLTSSNHPELSPINAGTAEMNGNDFRLSKTVDSFSPYNADDIDTAEIIRKNVFTQECEPLIKVCFAEPKKEPAEDDFKAIESDEQKNFPDNIGADEIRRKLSYLQEHPAYKAYLSVSEDLKSPIENAAEALDKFRSTLSGGNEDGINEKYLAEIKKAVGRYESADGNMPPEFKWYRVTDCAPIINASSFEHILYSSDVIRTVSTYGHYLLGIKNSDSTVCIAIPVDKDSNNPISHADDCTVYIRPHGLNYEYCTVCIAFEPDGQYFAPIC